MTKSLNIGIPANDLWGIERRVIEVLYYIWVEGIIYFGRSRLVGQFKLTASAKESHEYKPIHHEREGLIAILKFQGLVYTYSIRGRIRQDGGHIAGMYGLSSFVKKEKLAHTLMGARLITGLPKRGQGQGFGRWEDRGWIGVSNRPQFFFFQWTKAHSGDTGNKGADMLAGRGAMLDIEEAVRANVEIDHEFDIDGTRIDPTYGVALGTTLIHIKNPEGGVDRGATRLYRTVAYKRRTCPEYVGKLKAGCLLAKKRGTLSNEKALLEDWVDQNGVLIGMVPGWRRPKGACLLPKLSQLSLSPMLRAPCALTLLAGDYRAFNASHSSSSESGSRLTNSAMTSNAWVMMVNIQQTMEQVAQIKGMISWCQGLTDRHKLGVYYPPNPRPDIPILVFSYGGGFYMARALPPPPRPSSTQRRMYARDWAG
ncbi:hypothetical protein DFS33DRAFT_1454527 [Desarmillaria ectypa]|nr:hypothetical protein DFS33DRAFT_1454527 [Desarmillaria ectypa]